MVPPAGFRGRMNPCHLSFETNHQARRWFEHHSRTSTAITATTIESCKFSLLLDSSSSRRNRSKARSPWSFPDIKVAATTTMIANRARLALSAFLSFIPLFKVTAFFWTSSRYPSLLPIGNKNGSAVAHGKTILHASVNRDTDRNFYRILQIDRKANTAEIKTAYRRLAKMYHPDSNINEDTTAQFQELNRAYEVLSDPNLKRMYDMFGESGIGTSAATDEVRASAYERGVGRRRQQQTSMDPDIYDTYFSGNNRWTGGSGTTSVGSAEGFGSRTGLHKFVGDDVCIDFEVDFLTSILGGEAEVIVRSLETCDTCGGSGHLEDAKPCGFCDGTGVVTKVTDSPLGRFQAEQQCTACGGSGISPGNECPRCDGKGSIEKTKAIKVTIPAGVDSGSKLQVCGEGDAGPNGGPAGDLYIFLKVLEDPVFRRDGNDIYAEQTISCLDAMLGNSIRIPVVDGETTIDIPPGTQPGHTVCLKGSGAPSLIGQLNKRGNHYVTISVQIPIAGSDNSNALVKILKEQAAALVDPDKAARLLDSKASNVQQQEAKTIEIEFLKLEDLRAKAAEAKAERARRLELEEVAETRTNEITTLNKRLDDLRSQLRAATERKEEFKEKATQRDSKLKALAQRLGDIKSFIESDTS